MSPAPRRWRSSAARAICALAANDDPEEAIYGLVDGLLAEGEITEPPADVELLASLRRVRRITLLEMREAGRLVPEGAAYVIHVNQRHPETKRRFTIGHEVAHTFFDQAASASRAKADEDTGLFDRRDEEEYLCDLAAARSLLHPRWLSRLARARRPSLDALLEVAGICQASIEATAIQLSRLGVWRCTFASWELGHRKGELTRSQGGEPTPKLRARRVYAPSRVPFLPLNKSLPQTSLAWRALELKDKTEGDERLDLGNGNVIGVKMQSLYAPYYDETGELRPRVISCILWPRT